MRGEHMCLVETAIGVFGPVKRDRNNEHFSRRFIGKLCNGMGQSATQFARCGNEAVVFKRVDGVLQAGFVRAIRDRAHKWRRCKPAHATDRRTWTCRWTIKGIAASSAGITLLDRNFDPTSTADWNRGKTRQRGSAKSAGGRKEDATNSIHRTSENANYRTPTGSLRWWNVVGQRTEVTVEDAPHSDDGETARKCRQILISVYLYPVGQSKARAKRSAIGYKMPGSLTIWRQGRHGARRFDQPPKPHVA